MNEEDLTQAENWKARRKAIRAKESAKVGQTHFYGTPTGFKWQEASRQKRIG